MAFAVAIVACMLLGVGAAILAAADLIRWLIK
jgi:hypothetical protein